MAGLDFFVPPRFLQRTAWRAYTRMMLPVAGYLLGGKPWWRVGRFLGPSIENFYRTWHLDEIFEAWRMAGMVDVERRVMSMGSGLVMWGRKHHA